MILCWKYQLSSILYSLPSFQEIDDISRGWPGNPNLVHTVTIFLRLPVHFPPVLSRGLEAGSRGTEGDGENNVSVSLFSVRDYTEHRTTVLHLHTTPLGSTHRTPARCHYY